MAGLRDAGGLMQLDGTGALISGVPLPPGAAELLTRALRSGRLPEGPAQLLKEPRETLRSNAIGVSEPTLKALYPDGVRVVSDRPEFHWSPPSDAVSYRVSVTDDDLNEIAHSGLLHEPAWVPDAPLPRLRPLLWQVSVLRRAVWTTSPAPPETAPRFEIISKEMALRIEEARAANPPSHLLLAILYAQAGMDQDTAGEIDAISRLNPGSALASSLRTGLRTHP